MAVMRHLESADVILKNEKDNSMLYFFYEGTDVLGIAMSIHIHPEDISKSYIDFTEDEALREEINDLLFHSGPDNWTAEKLKPEFKET